MKKINRYELKNYSYEKLKEQELNKWLIQIFQDSNEGWLKKSKIHKKGKEKYGPDWPKDPDTIFRHLNTLSKPDVGILEKKIGGKGLPNKWRLRNSPYQYNELVVENEIENLKEVSKEIFTGRKENKNYCDITLDDKITVYGFPGQRNKDFDESFKNIQIKMKTAMTELFQLTWECRRRIFQDKLKDLPIDVNSWDYSLLMIFIYCVIEVGPPDFKKLYDWFDIGKKRLKVIPKVTLAKEMKKNFFSYLEVEDIIGKLKNHYFEKEFSEYLNSIFFEYIYYITNINDLVVVLHGGEIDRGIKLNASFKNWFNYSKKVSYMNDELMKQIGILNEEILRMEDERRRAEIDYQEFSLSEWIERNIEIYNAVKENYGFARDKK